MMKSKPLYDMRAILSAEPTPPFRTLGGMEITGQQEIGEELYQEIARRIVEAVHPKRIILFGSRARGDARPDSDVDIFVEWETKENPIDRRLRIRKLFRGRSWGLDILAYTPEEVAARRGSVASIVPVILEEGRTLYEQNPID